MSLAYKILLVKRGNTYLLFRPQNFCVSLGGEKNWKTKDDIQYEFKKIKRIHFKRCKSSFNIVKIICCGICCGICGLSEWLLLKYVIVEDVDGNFEECGRISIFEEHEFRRHVTVRFKGLQENSKKKIPLSTDVHRIPQNPI